MRSMMMTLSGATLAALVGCGVEGASQHGGEEAFLGEETEAELSLDGEEGFGEGAELVAEVEAKGSRFLFVAVSDEEGQFQGVGTIEELDPSFPDPAEHALMEEGNALDLFLAITSDDLEVPEELKAYEDHRLGKRGWFLEEAEVARTSRPRGICSNGEFKSRLRDWQPFINDEEKWRMDVGVSNGSDWTGPTCGTALPCSNPTFYSLYNNSYSWSIENVDEVKQQVAICAMNPYREVCSTLGGCNPHLGPKIYFQWRSEHDASTGTVFSKDIGANGTNTYYRWFWSGTPDSGNNDWDWRIKINQVKVGDSFDLGWIGEHRGW